MDNQYILLVGKSELLSDIKELWQKLNNHHIVSTEYFKDKYKEFTFEYRMKSLLDKTVGGDIQVLIAKDKNTDIKIGYCVSTVNSENSGEIDSLFIEEEYRRFGLGDMMIKKALEWLETKEPKEIVLTVAGGNEKVLDFYKRYGFYTTAVKLTKIKEKRSIDMFSFKEFTISSDKTMIKIDDVVALLGKSYWASRRSKEKIIKTIENSLCFGVYYKDKQIGFARIITDYTTFAYLCDVIIDDEYRGQGIGKALVSYIIEYPELRDVSSINLKTNDAHKLYEKYGFGSIEDPGKYMTRKKKKYK
jgi:diamine N-acetyltransferase